MPPSLRNAVRKAGDEKNLYNIIGIRGKAPEVRKNTYGGVLRLRLSEAKPPGTSALTKLSPEPKVDEVKGRQNI